MDFATGFVEFAAGPLVLAAGPAGWRGGAMRFAADCRIPVAAKLTGALKGDPRTWGGSSAPPYPAACVTGESSPRTLRSSGSEARDHRTPHWPRPATDDDSPD